MNTIMSTKVNNNSATLFPTTNLPATTSSENSANMTQHRHQMQPQTECKLVLLQYACGCQYQNSNPCACIVDCGAQITLNTEAPCPVCVNLATLDTQTASNLTSLGSINGLTSQRFVRSVSETRSNPFYHNASPTSSFSSSISWATAPSDISYSADYILPRTNHVLPTTDGPIASDIASPVVSETSDSSDGGVSLPMSSLPLLAIEQLSAYHYREPFDANDALFFAEQLFDNNSDASDANELGDAELYWTTECWEDEVEPFPSIPSFTVGDGKSLKSKVRRPKYEFDCPHRTLYGYNHGHPFPNASTSLIRTHSELYTPLPQSVPQSNTRFADSSDIGSDGDSTSTLGYTRQDVIRWTTELPTSGYEPFPNTKSSEQKRVRVQSLPRSHLVSSSSPALPLKYQRPPTPYYQRSESAAVHVIEDEEPSMDRTFKTSSEASSSQAQLSPPSTVVHTVQEGKPLVLKVLGSAKETSFGSINLSPSQEHLLPDSTVMHSIKDKNSSIERLLGSIKPSSSLEHVGKLLRAQSHGDEERGRYIKLAHTDHTDTEESAAEEEEAAEDPEAAQVSPKSRGSRRRFVALKNRMNCLPARQLGLGYESLDGSPPSLLDGNEDRIVTNTNRGRFVIADMKLKKKEKHVKNKEKQEKKKEKQQKKKDEQRWSRLSCLYWCD